MRHFFRRVASGFIAPSFALWKPRPSQQNEDEDTRKEIQTTINKIFLTSLQSEFQTLKIFSLDAEILAREIASHLDVGLGRLNSTKFNDGENSIQILDSVRGQNVFIVKNFDEHSVNDGIVELLLAVATMKKEGAESVTAIIPFFPYSLPSSSQMHNEVTEGRDFFTCFGADIVKMLQALGCDEIITLNTSMSAPKGFASSSKFLNVEATQLVAPYLIYSGIKDPVIVGARSNRLHLNAVNQIYKTFGLFNYNCGMGFYNDNDYIGQDFKDRDVVLFSNLIRTGSTVRKISKELKKKGAHNIYCYGFHGSCSNEQLVSLMSDLPVKELIMTNTIQHTYQNKKVRTISVAKFLAEIITIISEQKSLSDFRGSRQMLHYAYLSKIKQYNRRVQDTIHLVQDQKHQPISSIQKAEIVQDVKHQILEQYAPEIRQELKEARIDLLQQPKKEIV